MMIDFEKSYPTTAMQRLGRKLRSDYVGTPMMELLHEIDLAVYREFGRFVRLELYGDAYDLFEDDI